MEVRRQASKKWSTTRYRCGRWKRSEKWAAAETAAAVWVEENSDSVRKGREKSAAFASCEYWKRRERSE